LAATNNVGDLKDRIAELETENAALKEQIGKVREWGVEARQRWGGCGGRYWDRFYTILKKKASE